MIRTITVAALLCVSAPTMAAQCITAAAIEPSLTAENGISQLPDAPAARFRALYNAVPPVTSYEGPVYVKDLPERRVLLFVTVENGKACIDKIEGEAREIMIRVMNGGGRDRR